MSIVNSQYNHVFIHIPKTAGISVQNWYRETYGKFHKCMHGDVNHHVLSHVNARMKSWCVVRNPYDLVHSWYRYKHQMLQESRHRDADEHAAWRKGFEYWLEHYIEKINYIRKPNCIALIDADPDNPPEGSVKMDPIIDNFIIGADGVIGMSKDTGTVPLETPAVIRGIAKRKVIKRCIDEGRPWYYIDTGYFGNGKTKLYHRVTKNNMQYTGKIHEDCPDDRFVKTGVGISHHRPGDSILICPPSQKAMNYWNMDLQEWLKITVDDIKKHTDRPIIIREKGSRHERVNTDTMEMALAKNVHCMVTFNSIAAVESLIYGKPVFTMGPKGTNAAEPYSNNDLSKIDDPFMPTMDEVRNLLCNLSYQQFTVHEMRSGYAWEQLNKNGF